MGVTGSTADSLPDSSIASSSSMGSGRSDCGNGRGDDEKLLLAAHDWLGVVLPAEM